MQYRFCMRYCSYKSNRSSSFRTAGYTLVEIMIVLSIIAVLLGSSIYLLVGNVDAAKLQRVDSDIQTISTQLKTYEMMNYTYPTTDQGLQALVSAPSAPPKPKRWTQLMSQVPVDPWGRPYVYVYPGKKNPSSFDLYSMGPDGKANTEDDAPRK